MEIIELVSAYGTARICRKGAHVMDVRFGDEQLLWLSTKAEEQAATPGAAIRGGVPVCFPWFGKDPDGRPAHGFARNVDWLVVGRSADRALFALDDDGASRELWPHRFHAELEIRLDDAVDFLFSVTNTDETPFSFTYALHSYFAADATRAIAVDDLVTVDGAIDTVFQDVPDRVVIRDANRRVDVDARGMTSAIVWNPGLNAMPDIGEQRSEFVCVERGRVGAAAVSLAPDETYGATMRLSVPARPAS